MYDSSMCYGVLRRALLISTCQMTLIDPDPDSVDGLKEQAEQDPD